MRLLLDTHILLWIFAEPEQLSDHTRKRIESLENDVFFSAASVWEIAIKTSLGRPDFVVDPGMVLIEAGAVGLNELPIGSEAALGLASLPRHHRDPFDRLLVVQARQLSAKLLTADAVLTQYGDAVELV